MTFNENNLPDDFMVDNEPLQNLELSIERCIDIEQSSLTKTSEAQSAQTEGDTADLVGATEENQVKEEAGDSHSTGHPVQRSVRTRNPPFRYGLAYIQDSVAGIQEPRGDSEAVPGLEKEQWLAAMALDVKSLEAMGTWTIVDRPQSRKNFPGRRVLAVMRDAMGQVDGFKARYVVRGIKQVEGIDFNETFSPTCKPKTKRILLALGAQDDLVLHQMDVKSAFLNSPLAETVYMEQPEGFSSGDN